MASVPKRQGKLIQGNILDIIGTSVSKKSLASVSGDTLEKYGQQIIEDLKKSLVESGHSRTSQLLQSIDFDMVEGGGKVRMDIILNDYYKYVNDGRKGKKSRKAIDRSRIIQKTAKGPSLPPFAPIAKWVGTVAGFSPKKLGFSVKSQRVRDKVKKVRIVDAIRWGIYNKGIEPTYFYTAVINKELEKEIKDSLTKAMGKSIAINIVAK